MNIAAPITQAISNDRHIVAEPYALTVDGWHISISVGFEFDGASIPRFFWRVVGHPMQGEALPASLIHDAMYRTRLMDKEQADNLFYRLLRINEVGRIKSWLMYRAVKHFGGGSWRIYNIDQRNFARLFVKLRKGKGNEL
jgi:hypothetical protein